MAEPTAQDEWNLYKDYADRVLVTVAAVESAVDDYGNDEMLILTYGARWERDWLIAEVLDIAKSGSEEVPRLAAPHILQVRSQNFHWGADAVAYEIVLLISTWAVTSAAWDVTKILAKKLHHRLIQEENISTDVPTEDELVNRAKWLVAERYKEDSTNLELRPVEVHPEPVAATVVLAGQSGWLYHLDLEWLDQLVVTGRVKRELVDHGSVASDRTCDAPDREKGG